MRTHRLANVSIGLVLVGAASACGTHSRRDANDKSATLAEPFSDDRLRTAAGCPGCTILQRAKLKLPLTGVSAVSAKMAGLDASGQVVTRVATMRADGTVDDERNLLGAEQAERRKKFGKLTAQLHARKSTSGSSDELKVWIWLSVPQTYPRKEALLADASAAEAHEAVTRGRVAAAAAPVLGALKAAKARLIQDGATTPLVRAVVPVHSLAALEALPEVDEIGLEADPEPLHSVNIGSCSIMAPKECHSWLGTLRITAAHALSTGSGQKICVKEKFQANDYTDLTGIQAIANITGDVEEHTTLTIATIKNDVVNPGGANDCAAPNAMIYLANWIGYAGSGGINQWCRDRDVRTIVYPYRYLYSFTGQTGIDYEHDWLAKNSPYILTVASTGNFDEPCPGCECPSDGDYALTTCHVTNRGYNGLVVGGMWDGMTGSDPSDDSIPEGHTTWRNFDTPHDDYELPHVVANSQGHSVVNRMYSGSSGAASIVAGVVLLPAARDSLRFNAWPEMKRAVMLATSTYNPGVTAPTNLPVAQDIKGGVGTIDAYKAADLGNPTADISPNSSTAAMGRYATTLSFSTDFGANGYSTYRWRANITGTGTKRLRVAIAWDASPVCSSANSCSGNALDGDIDLHVWKTTTSGFDIPVGFANCSSTSWDASYEFCDLQVSGGETYLLVPQKLSNNASTTYFGIAWYQY